MSTEAGRCGETPPALMVGVVMSDYCCLPHGHLGWHRSDDGCEWGPMSTPTTREVANDAQAPQIGAGGVWRAIWDLPGTPFPAWADHHDEQAAHLFALRKSREIGGEVAVVRVGEGA